LRGFSSLHVWSHSRRMGLVPTIGCALLWLSAGAVVTALTANALATRPVLAQIVSFAIAAVVAFGGLVSYWLICGQVEFRRRGFRVRWVSEEDWLYEERAPTGQSRFLPLQRVITGDAYPAPCDVRIAGETAWSSQVPSWAWNRREEILRRIALCFGAERGGAVRFLDLGTGV
jgi:hypothetical protein